MASDKTIVNGGEAGLEETRDRQMFTNQTVGLLKHILKIEIFHKKISNLIKVMQTVNKVLLQFKTTDTSLDLDGDPRSYNSDNTGIEYNSNGINYDKATGKIMVSSPGLVFDKDGQPVVQKSDEPVPGNFVTKTAIYFKTRKSDFNHNLDSPHQDAYLNPSIVNYLVGSALMSNQGIRKGDIGYTFDKNGNKVYFIIGDENHSQSNDIAEMSEKLAEALSITIEKINYSRDSKGNLEKDKQGAIVKYVGTDPQKKDLEWYIWKNSGDGYAHTQQEIDEMGQQAAKQ